MQIHPNFERYENKELSETLIKIDDKNYPENAVKLLSLLLERERKTLSELIMQYSNQSNDYVSSIILFPFIKDDDGMVEKLNRIAALMKWKTIGQWGW